MSVADVLGRSGPELSGGTQLASVWVAVTIAALGLHLFVEYRSSFGSGRGRAEDDDATPSRPASLAITKLIASTGFLFTAIHAGALGSEWGRWIFVGLVLSWCGDAFLLARARSMFLAGLVAFLLGHVGYCVAFVTHGFDTRVALAVAPVVLIAALVVDRWLRDHVQAGMRLPVRAYIVVISIMLTLAIAAWRGGGSHLLLLGAVSFYLSDLSVASDRFVRRDFLNRLWGLPAYYLGQLCLALSVLPHG
ncbi:putative MEMBRANE PROTEIN [Enhygromyxa salina]|uniref:Putative MEMBRANE PROTEIN n=1 Tax=Enhygromyxa salina TaxID=215803 RepID=A0A0C2CWF4_9BACT|nr:lysoplasmalogenase [Enhygromyxa salina]KIG15376.1 putative MEMBRANE PROTEIN [Enhygromyxa salina]